MSSASVSFQDRTHEFHSCVASLRKAAARRPLNGTAASLSRPASRNSTPGTARSSLDSSRTGAMPKSEFALAASQIGHGINECGAKLQKLAQLAKRKTLFDDRPVEITELTYIIKQDISALNTQLADLRAKMKSSGRRSGGGRQVMEHNENVVASLQSKLADTSLTFKDVLEVRTQNMKAAKSREAQFTSKPAAFGNGAGQNQPGTPSLFELSRPASQRPPDGDTLVFDMDESAATNTQYQQMQLMESPQQQSYLGERGMAIESIERTITELGGMFNQLMQMVAEQRETVQRIEYNTEDISTNISGAQRELIRYYNRVTSNRWLMLRMFGILMVFFLLFVLLR